MIPRGSEFHRLIVSLQNCPSVRVKAHALGGTEGGEAPCPAACNVSVLEMNGGFQFLGPSVEHST